MTQHFNIWFLVACSLLLSSSAFSEDLPVHAPRTCAGAENIKIEGQHIKGDDFAVKATEHCTVTILDSTLEANTGVILLDNSEVFLENVRIIGATFSLDVRGSSKVNLNKVTTTGDILVADTATVNSDKSSKRIDESDETAGIKSQAKLEEAEPIRCVGKKTIVVENKIIRAKGDAISIFGACNVTIRNSKIIAEDDALVARGNPTISIVDSEIIATNDALRLVGRVKLTLKGSKIVGKIKRVGKVSISGLGGNKLN